MPDRSKPRKPEPPAENVATLLGDIVDSYGPCLDGCPSEAVVPNGWCLFCRCEAARRRICGER